MQGASAFESNLRTAVVAGAIAGTLGLLTWPVQLPELVLAFVVAAGMRGTHVRRGFSLLSAAFVALVMGVMLPREASLLVLGAATAVAVLLASRTPTPGAMAIVGAFGAVFAVLGDQVAEALVDRMRHPAVPELLYRSGAGAVFAFFVGLAQLPAHLRLFSDAVEERAATVLPTLSGEFEVLVRRALDQYRGARTVLAQLPREPHRVELRRTLEALTLGTLVLADEWSNVERDLQGAVPVGDGPRLRRLAEEAEDPVARRHLELAASASEEEERRRAELKLGTTRALARMEAEVAQLARARGALVAMRSGHSQVRSAELAALARRLSALTANEALESDVAREVSTGAELDQLEAALDELRTQQPAARVSG